MDLFKLVGSVFVDTADANQSLQKTDKNAQKTGETFKKVAGTAAKVGGAIVTASAAAVTAIVGMANKASEAADVIDKGSIRMGISAEKYQELAYAAGQSGVEMSTLEAAAKKLEGTGINFDDAIQQVMAMGTASERSAKAAELFGTKVAYEMSPLIEQSGESFDGLIDRAHELGLVMSGEDVKAGVQMGDTMNDIKKAAEGLFNQLGAKLFPVVQAFLDKALDYLPTFLGFIDRMAPILDTLFSNLMPPLMDLVDAVLPIVMSALEQLLPPIIEIVSQLLPVIVGILSEILPLIQPILDVVSALLPVVKSLLEKAIMPLLEMLQGALGTVIQVVADVLEFIADLIEENQDFITDLIQLALMPLLTKLQMIFKIIEIFMPVLKPILEVVMKIISAVMKLMSGALGPLIKLFNGALTGAMQAVQAVMQGLADFFSAAWDGVKAAWNAAPEFFSNLWEGIKNGLKAALNGMIWLLNKLIDGVNLIITPIRFIIAGIAQAAGADWTMDDVKIPQVPQLAKGGLIDQEGLTLTGENGPELQYMPRGAAVVPLDKALGNDAIADTLAAILAVLKKLMTNLPSYGVYLDGKAMVGKLAPDIDAALGKLTDRNRRYA